MNSPTIRPFLLALALPACLAAPGWAGEDSINNTVLVKVPAKVKYDWKLSFVSGQDPKKDSIKIVPFMTQAPVATVLKKKDDVMVFKPGKTYSVFFTPNFGDDGSKYVVKLTDGRTACKDCDPKPKEDQYVMFKAEKPESKAWTMKSSRKLVLTLDWNADHYIQFYGVGQGEELAKEDTIKGYFKDDTLTLEYDCF